MQIETLKLDEIVLDPANVRAHPAKNIEAIKGSLSRWGQQRPIVIDARNVVVAGNGTVIAARELGWTEIRAVRSELAGAERTAYSLADNASAALSNWSAEVAGLVTDLKVSLPDIDLDSLGLADLPTLFSQPTDEDWATQFEEVGDTSGVDNLCQVTFVLDKSDRDRLLEHLKKFAGQKNEAIILWLNQSSS